MGTLFRIGRFHSQAGRFWSKNRRRIRFLCFPEKFWISPKKSDSPGICTHLCTHLRKREEKLNCITTCVLTQMRTLILIQSAFLFFCTPPKRESACNLRFLGHPAHDNEVNPARQIALSGRLFYFPALSMKSIRVRDGISCARWVFV